MRPLLQHRPTTPLAWACFALISVVVVTMLALPLLHDVHHEQGAMETDCPAHILQTGLSLVLLALCLLLVLLSDTWQAWLPAPPPAALPDPRGSSRQPRAPPLFA
ncbi:MAG: hypothetical protein O2782_03755 [bacterium]|nr:hypothetical protein [bacterium]